MVTFQYILVFLFLVFKKTSKLTFNVIIASVEVFKLYLLWVCDRAFIEEVTKKCPVL